ncbi:Aste57867_7356 [Aphanomyces stellatus]|uniref:Aste57867_7356 protein n=1 Tax=Aphanomyces stellatus TaxID=120398 RepID=A0A485KI78_9STRA|nr:hypothetical protein As57867_007330 [Aphanomyces stellatus]VFT84273.1 Aste57867_7356 [Aphanomyces stellatus]
MDAFSMWPKPLVLNTTSSNLRGLILRNTGGFVHEDPVNPTPSVVFRASNSDLLDAMTINLISTTDMDVLEFEFMNGNHQTVLGNYILDIYMPTASLQFLETTDDRDTLVYPNTLGTDPMQDMTISALGTGNVYIQSGNLAARQLTVEARGSGYVQLAIDHTVNVTDATLMASHLGSIALSASRLTAATGFVTLNIGSGNVFVSACNTAEEIVE